MPYQQTHKNKNILFVALSLYLLIIATYFVYLPGINGQFMLDDFGNLPSMGRYTHLGFWDNFWLFLLEGNSGPTGRPISLASFYLNDSIWPSPPKSFTYTNILIHLLNGLLIFWFTHKLATLLRLTASQASIFSLMATAIWLLHPMHTTTVLYIIQRMTELSATFTLAGLLFYLYGREQLTKSTFKASLKLTLGLGVSLLLAILSKENGILLVAYILVIEYFLLQPFKNAPPHHFHRYLIPMVILPFLLILAYMAEKTWAGGGFSNREFTLNERLLTQARVLFDYLYYIFIPHTGDSTLFHDDYVISKNLLTPWTTLPAVIGIVSLILSAFVLRNRLPIIAFAIAWFLGGHLLESSAIALELYYEHRNYLPMLGFFIAAAWIIVKYGASHKQLIAIATGISLCISAFLVSQNTSLWSNKTKLITSWYEYHPNSMRTQAAYNVFVKPLDTNNLTNEQRKSQDRSSFAHLWKLKQSCIRHLATEKNLTLTLEGLGKHPVHAGNVTALNEFLENWLKGECKSLSLNQIIAFLENSTSINTVKRNAIYRYTTYTWLASLYQSKHDFGGTMHNLEKAYRVKPNIDLLLLRAQYLVSAGLYEDAIELLTNTNKLKKGIRKTLVLKIRQKEINNLKQAITMKMTRTTAQQ